VLFDTAPTGHTIRLLQLPGDWTGYLEEGKGDTSCLGPLAGLDTRKASYAEAVGTLTDPSRTRLVLVARPQRSSLLEVERTLGELGAIGMGDAHLVVNGALAGVADDPLEAALRRREADALAHLPDSLRRLPRSVIPLRSMNMVGVPALRVLLDDAGEGGTDATQSASPVPGETLASLVDHIEVAGHGLVMCMGKGGVGKTTVAAAIAVALADRGHDVLLTTTDPAAHLAGTLDGDVIGLTVERIDPHRAVAEYRDHVTATKGAALDDAGRAVLAEDLKSPCTEEIAVFQRFASAVASAEERFVVIDTAPTGHTLLLLDATGSYHREMTRQAGEAATVTPLMRLQDPDLTRVVLVTLPETTPVLEAEALQRDLERAGIHPYAWIVNQSISAAGTTSPFLLARAATEAGPLARVDQLAERTAVLPLLAEEPVGAGALRRLVVATGPVRAVG